MKKIAFLILFILAACGQKNGGANVAQVAPVAPVSPAIPLAPTYASIQANIFQPKCYSCHTGGSPAGEDDLSNYDSLVKCADIISGKPEESELYKDVAGGVMPENGTKLSDVEIKAIYDWIKNGLVKE